METSLSGFGLPVSFGDVKRNAVPAVIGAVGAGVALFAVDKAMKYPIGSFGTIDAKLAGVHPALPGAARFGVAVVGIPAVALLASKYAKLRIPASALTGATTVLALVGIAAAVKAVKPDLNLLPGLAGAALLTETVGGPFAGAALGVDEVGKFGGIGGNTGMGYASVMGSASGY